MVRGTRCSGGLWVCGAHQAERGDSVAAGTRMSAQHAHRARALLALPRRCSRPPRAAPAPATHPRMCWVVNFVSGEAASEAAAAHSAGLSADRFDSPPAVLPACFAACSRQHVPLTNTALSDPAMLLMRSW